MSTIIETALEAVGKPIPAKYEAVAQRVQSALEAREAEIFDSLVESAVAFGIDRDKAHAALVKAGLQPGDCDGDVECLEDKVNALTAALNKALDWARTKGYRG